MGQSSQPMGTGGELDSRPQSSDLRTMNLRVSDDVAARDSSPWRRVWRDYLRPRWRPVALAAACAIAAGVLNGVILGMIARAVDTLLSPHSGLAWATLPALVGALGLARGLALIVQSTLVNRIGHGVVSDIQRRLVGNFMRGDLARLRATHSGTFVSKVLFDAGMVRDAATTGVMNYLQQGLTLVAMLVVMLIMDWPLALLVLAVAPFVGGVLRDYAKRTTRAAHGAMEESAALTTAVMESLGGVRVVKMENKEAFEEARVGAAIDRRQKHIIAGADARAMAAPVSEIMVTLMIAAVVSYAGWRFQLGATHLGPFAIRAITPGMFTAFLAALMMGAQALRQVAAQQTVINEGEAAARRLFATLDVEPLIRDAPGAAPLPAGEATVRLENVSFAYGPGEPVLDGLSLEARRGEIVALVGPSGAGKSTVLGLIPRFYDVGAGRVTIDGHDVRDVALASLRAHIALVTQEPFLFDDTVRANIAYARDGATPNEIEAAARQAAAHDFILGLPGGYDTLVGEAGARISGGQRQRIAIARAFLKDAPILLLDEATSALDTESEAQVQAALERLMAGRTTIVIAHRLSTVRGADRIYVIDRGRLAEEGDHARLMRRQGLYARLAGAQNLDLAPEAAE
jgi:ATP-binding cassette, subfamily B, bacterial MsbA